MGKWKTYKPKIGGLFRDGNERYVCVSGQPVMRVYMTYDGYSDSFDPYEYGITLLLPDKPLSFWVDKYTERRGKVLLDWLASQILDSMGLLEDQA